MIRLKIYLYILKMINKTIIDKFKKLNKKNNSTLNKYMNRSEKKYYLINPKGLNCYLWMTNIDDNNYTISIYYNNRTHNYDIKYYLICSNNILYSKNGTLLKGVLFNYNKTNYFTANNVIYYKNKYVNNNNYKNKINIFNDLFKNEIKQISYNKNFIVIGLPIINDDINVIKNISNKLIYNIYSISYINLCSNEIYHLKNDIINKKIYANFKITADIEFDMYNLYCNNDIYYSKAIINDYKTSVYMNSLFRNIRENINLDYLEESEDEDEFQKGNIDKYVDLNKSYIMKCEYIKEFNSWTPVKIIENVKETSIDIIKNIVK